MPTVTADEFQSTGVADDLDNEVVEALLDLAIDCTELLGQVDIGDLAGAAGSKSIAVSSQQRFVIFLAARIIYWGFHQDLGSSNTGPLSLSVPDIMGNSATWQALKEAAQKLEEPDWSGAFL